MMIAYQLAEEGSCELLITDLQGRTFERRVLSDASGEIHLDLNGFARGIYFISLSSRGSDNLHGRIVLIE
jgi:hypothetical protein